MSESMESQIRAAEEQLRIAMLRSDVKVLDALLAPGLLFTNHLGQLLSKNDDLAAHRSGLLKVQELIPSEQQVLTYGNVAVVSVRMRLSGTYDGSPANGDFRFTRVWAVAPDSSSWHIVVAHATAVLC
jgi:ketosteroid isomerase-like protein